MKNRFMLADGVGLVRGLEVSMDGAVRSAFKLIFLLTIMSKIRIMNIYSFIYQRNTFKFSYSHI